MNVLKYIKIIFNFYRNSKFLCSEKDFNMYNDYTRQFLNYHRNLKFGYDERDFNMCVCICSFTINESSAQKTFMSC